MNEPINHGSERNRQRYERLAPEQKEALAQFRAEHRTPEYRAEEARIRELAEAEFPPLQPDEPLLALVATLRTERERQGLSLTDVVDRTGLNLSTISRLELGKVPNPTYGTLRAYATALGMGLEISAKPEG